MDLAALHLLSAAASEARERLHVERRLSVSNTEAVDATTIPESPTNANAIACANSTSDSANQVAKQGSEVKVDNNEDMEVEIPQTPIRLDEDKRSASNSNAGLQLAQSSERNADPSDQTAMTDENEHQYEPDNANDMEASSDELNDAESVALQNPRTLRKRKRRLHRSNTGNDGIPESEKENERPSNSRTYALAVFVCSNFHRLVFSAQSRRQSVNLSTRLGLAPVTRSNALRVAPQLNTNREPPEKS